MEALGELTLVFLLLAAEPRGETSPLQAMGQAPSWDIVSLKTGIAITPVQPLAGSSAWAPKSS